MANTEPRPAMRCHAPLSMPAPHPFQHGQRSDAGPPVEPFVGIATPNPHPAMGARTPDLRAAGAASRSSAALGDGASDKAGECMADLSGGTWRASTVEDFPGADARDPEERQRQREQWVERVRRKKRRRADPSTSKGSVQGPTVPRQLLEVMPMVRRTMEAMAAHPGPDAVLPRPCPATVLGAHPAPDAFTLLRDRRAFPSEIDRVTLRMELERVVVACSQSSSAGTAKWILHEAMAEYLLGVRVTGLEYLPHELRYALRTDSWAASPDQEAPAPGGREAEAYGTVEVHMLTPAGTSRLGPATSSLGTALNDVSGVEEAMTLRMSQPPRTTGTWPQPTPAGVTQAWRSAGTSLGDLAGTAAVEASTTGSPQDLEELLTGSADIAFLPDFMGATATSNRAPSAAGEGD